MGQLVSRPSRKASARTLYIDGKLFGNPGNWGWVEDREQVRVCEPCAVVYPPSTAPLACPRHGDTTLIAAERVTFTPPLPPLARTPESEEN